jgi:hypothetical protein
VVCEYGAGVNGRGGLPLTDDPLQHFPLSQLGGRHRCANEVVTELPDLVLGQELQPWKLVKKRLDELSWSDVLDEVAQGSGGGERTDPGSDLAVFTDQEQVHAITSPYPYISRFGKLRHSFRVALQIAPLDFLKVGAHASMLNTFRLRRKCPGLLETSGDGVEGLELRIEQRVDMCAGAQ